MIVALIVVLIAGYAIVKSVTSNKSSPAIVGMRAVVMPTGDATRTVVVAPCGTGASVLSANAVAVSQTTGATTILLPQGTGERIVLVPGCSGGHAGFTGLTQLPSSAFVLAPGTPVPPIGAAQASTSNSSTEAGVTTSAQFELTVPTGSPIRTVVLTPCEKANPSTPAQQLLIPTGNSSVAVAPTC